MKYEITTPGAAAMVAQERLSQTERNQERVSASAYGKFDPLCKQALPNEYHVRGRVADVVAERIERQYWCDVSGQGAVDELRALLNGRGNSPAWQMYALRETMEQIRESRASTLVAIGLGKEEYDEANGITRRIRFQQR
jgi:hypothetical protein